MHSIQVVEDLAKKYGVSVEELIRMGMELALKARKKDYLCERLEILSRYKVSSVEELEGMIQRGEIVEHPTWEDLIEIKNLEAEVKEIDRDLGLVHPT